MSEPRITRRGVEEIAKDVFDLSRELGLVPEVDRWFVQPGSPTYGNRWKLYGEKPTGEVYHPYWTDNGYIGKTARQAHDRLCVVFDTLLWVQVMQEEK